MLTYKKSLKLVPFLSFPRITINERISTFPWATSLLHPREKPISGKKSQHTPTAYSVPSTAPRALHFLLRPSPMELSSIVLPILQMRSQDHTD